MDWLREIIGERLFKEIKEKLGDKKLLQDDGNLIPKHRFDELITQRDSFKLQFDQTNEKMKELEQLEGQIGELKKGREIAEAKLAETTVQSKIRLAAVKRGAKNADDVLTFADLGAVLEGNKPIDEIVQEIYQNKPYLFGADALQSGANPAVGGGENVIARQFGSGIRGELL